jgi:hypothetical protein
MLKYRRGTAIGIKVKIYATIPGNKPNPREPMHNNEWRISRKPI